MSGNLGLTLSNALTGLNVNKQALSVLSQNIANANTPDYTRKTVSLEAQYIDGTGAGVKVGDVTRKVDDFLQMAVQQQQGNVGKLSVLDSYAQRVQAYLGNPATGTGLDAYVTSYFNSLQVLAQSPSTSSLRVSAISSAVALASNISGLASNIQNLRYQADQEIVQSVNAINKDLKDLYDTNQQIASANAIGVPQGELLDKRDALIRDLGQYLDINTFTLSNNTVRVYTTGGITLLDDTLGKLSYTAANSKEGFDNNSIISDITVSALDTTGNVIGSPSVLVKGGQSSQIVSPLTTGKLRGLMDIRDQKMPAILDQLDNLAANLRDTVNAIHNAGTGYPGATTLTSTRLLNPNSFSQWNGSVMIGLVDAQGNPISNNYAGETGGLPPLTIDLSKLDAGAGYGPGQPTIQSIIDEINSYYGPASTKVSVGNLSSIKLTSDTKNLTNSSPFFDFDFDLSNISGGNSKFFVTGVQAYDDTGTATGTITSTIPSVALDDTNTFQTTSGSPTVTITTAAAHTLKAGDIIYVPDPGSAINGIPQGQFGRYYTVQNPTSNTFEITAGAVANATGAVGVASQAINTPYSNVTPGEQLRTASDGKFSANLSANPNSTYYTFKVNVGVVDGNGNISTSTISYRVVNNQNSIYNTRYAPITATGDGVLSDPIKSGASARAIMVDKDGNELPRDANGKYLNANQGYLKLVTQNSSTFLAINSLDSQEVGFPLKAPPVAGTNRGFSHYFELNNLFASNNPTSTGDTVKGSALRMKVEDRIQSDPTLLSTGILTQVSRPADPLKAPYYSYQRSVGDSTIIKQLADLNSTTLTFAYAGGIGTTTSTFNGYSSQILGMAASDADTMKSNQSNAQALLDGFNQRASAVSGVNLDEELANTVIYQNAYAASARVITVVNELFDKLINTF